MNPQPEGTPAQGHASHVGGLDGQPPPARTDRRSNRHDTRWRQVLEAAQDAYIAVDVAGRVVDWNQRAERLFGFPRPGAPGPPPVERLVAPQHRAALAAGMAQVVRDGTRTGDAVFQLVAIARNGRPFAAECTLWGVDRRGTFLMHAFVRDVSERRRAQNAAARLAAIVEGSSDAIYTRNLHGTLLTWNAGAERIFGWSALEVIGRPSTEVMPDEDFSELKELLAMVAQGQSVPGVEKERLTRSRTVVPLSIQSSPVHGDHGRVVAVSTIARDLTERRRMSETLDETLLALHAAAEEARASEEITRRFLADAAHQLRTPVTGIRACAETLLRGAAPEDVERLLTVMIRETSRAGRLVTSLLTIAQLDQGVPLEVQPVDIVVLCQDEVERLALLSAHLDVVLDVRRETHQQCPLDRARLREILSNLGDNARRHAVGQIRCSVDIGAVGIRVLMTDDGPGVLPSHRDRIFERFVSLDGQSGSGLGLSVARALARAMGGELRYEDGFLLTLPTGRAA